MTITISDNGIAFIEKWEGLKLSSYLCPAKIWTIGIGSTIVHGVPVKPGQSCTRSEAYAYFREHLVTSVYPALKLITVPLTQNQIDALCSLIYNIGANAFSHSSLLKYLNASNYLGAADQFLEWNKKTVITNGVSKKVVVRGLTSRRREERELFNTRFI